MPASARELVEQVMTAFASGDEDAIDRLLADDYIQHNELGEGRDGVKRGMRRLARALSDVAVEIHDVIAEGDRVVARMTISGTHTGEFLGVAPSGERLAWAAIDIWRIEDGRLAEHWDCVDQLSLLRQLGLAPSPGGRSGHRRGGR